METDKRPTQTTAEIEMKKIEIVISYWLRFKTQKNNLGVPKIYQT